MTGNTRTAHEARVQDASAALLRRHRFKLIELLPWLAAIAVFYLLPGYRGLATQVLVLILFALSVD